jgi:hypothetical protein
MIGSTAGVGDLVDRLTRHGVDAIIGPLIGPGGDLVSLGWAPGVTSLPVSTPPQKTPPQKTPPKKSPRTTTARQPGRRVP